MMFHSQARAAVRDYDLSCFAHSSSHGFHPQVSLILYLSSLDAISEKVEIIVM
jgi:hypothetical protein